MSYNRTEVFRNQIEKTKRTIVVRGGYRTNPESLIEGGFRVKVIYKSGYSCIYENVKNTVAYIKKIYQKNDNDILDIVVLD